MFSSQIEIKKQTDEVNAANERLDELVPVGLYYAQKTESGGRENLFASRIVNTNEVVFTIRYTSGVKAGMYVIYEGRAMLINTVYEEGRKKYTHLKCTESDGDS